jgi:hypothetical protein
MKKRTLREGPPSAELVLCLIHQLIPSCQLKRLVYFSSLFDAHGCQVRFNFGIEMFVITLPNLKFSILLGDLKPKFAS